MDNDKLDQMAARNIRISLDKPRASVSRSKATASPKENLGADKYDSCDKNLPPAGP